MLKGSVKGKCPRKAATDKTLRMTNLLTLAAIFILAALAYRFRERLFAPLRRFEARNTARRAEEFQALFDRNAHYRQTVKLAEEQVEEVMKTSAVDPRTGHHYDHTRRYIEASPAADASMRQRIYSDNALGVYPRLRALCR